MAGTLESLAAQLGADVMKAMDETGDQDLFMEVANTIGTASQTIEEAFLTDIRLRLAERKARQLLSRKLAQHRAETPRKPGARPPGQPPAAKPGE